ncbi:SCO2522 family protein [Nocardia asiatica]|uniref:SCO2522 family protein n=1 Tax=Nocardia asiatica TaxID=209252 RepID=UPI003EE131E3
MTERPRIAQVPLSHLSIEVGRLPMADLDDSEDHVRAQFSRIAPLVTAFTADAKAEFGTRARVSTCFLIDDYFGRDTSPSEILGKLLGAAQECGLTIDYLARETGCVDAPLGSAGDLRIPLADMVAARVVAEPPVGSTGRRDSGAESGWLCNGDRAGNHGPGQAMHPRHYEPPKEQGEQSHSIFLDVQLWSKAEVEGRAEERVRWSAQFLASIWQLLRLGMLRYNGEPVVEPQPWRPDDGWPQRWSELPSVVKLEPRSKPFAAYRSLSMLPQHHLGIAAAVQMILNQIDLEQEVVEQIIERGRREEIPVWVPREVTERIGHILLPGH